MECHELPNNVWSLLHMLIKLPHASTVLSVTPEKNCVEMHIFEIV